MQMFSVFLHLFYAECPIGYKSIDGAPCNPCPQGFWGENCKTECSCKKHERYMKVMIYFDIIYLAYIN